MKHIVLKGTPPSTQNIYFHKGHMVYMSKIGKDTKESYQWEIKRQYKDKPTTKDIAIIIEFYFKDKKRRDIDNFNKLILDAGTGMIWKDDSQIMEMTLRKFIDKKHPRVEIFIL